MRGWSSIVVGSGLMVLAVWAHLTSFFSAAAIPIGLAGVFLVYRGLQGVEVADAGDPTVLGDFISNPAEALVEAAAEKAEEWLTERRETEASGPYSDGQAQFDADAAFARYMANREKSPSPSPEALRPSPGFGRKGL